MTAIVLYDRHVNGHANSFCVLQLASFPVSTSTFFSHVVKKSGREPGQIRHVKCVISTGRVRGFVECSDLAALRG